MSPADFYIDLEVVDEVLDCCGLCRQLLQYDVESELLGLLLGQFKLYLWRDITISLYVIHRYI
jgi:hypothetical protein